MGLSVENCEHWFERAVGVMMMGMFVLIVIRVSFFFFFEMIWVEDPIEFILYSYIS